MKRIVKRGYSKLKIGFHVDPYNFGIADLEVNHWVANIAEKLWNLFALVLYKTCPCGVPPKAINGENTKQANKKT